MQLVKKLHEIFFPCENKLNDLLDKNHEEVSKTITVIKNDNGRAFK